jgi:uncharacterized protein (TIGR02099 family)
LKKLARLARRAALYGGLAALVVTALTLSLLRFWLLPDVGRFREPLQTRIEAVLGETVRIEHLGARLRGFHPELTLGGFEILDAGGRPTLRLDDLRIGVDLWRSLAQGTPVFGRIRIVGARLSIRRRPDGSVAVAGLGGGGGAPPAWLLADGRFELLDCALDYQDLATGAPPLDLGKADIRLVNGRNRHRVGIGFKLPEALGAQLRLALDAEGDLLRADGWRGTAYLEARRLDLARTGGVQPAAAFGLVGGTADVRAWARWQGGLKFVAGDFKLGRPTLIHRPSPETAHSLALNGLSGRFLWRPETDGWRLDLARFVPDLTRPWPETRLAVAVGRAPDGTLASVRAGLSYLNLGDIGLGLRALNWPDGEAGAALRTAAPRGTLHDLQVFYAPAAPLAEQWAVCGEFRDLAAAAYQGAPGFAGLGGRLCGHAGAGRATLAIDQGRLDPAALGLKRPVVLDQAHVELDWRQTATDWTLEAPALDFRNPDLAGQGRLRLVLPKNPEASPFLDLRAQFTGPDVAALQFYLPYGLIPSTSGWMERALLRGRVQHWDLLFHGPTRAFPFYRNEGVFQARIDAEDVDLRFHPEWPPLTRAAARIAFEGPGVVIDSERGRLGRGEIVTAHGTVADLDSAEPWLNLAGTVRSDVADALDFLSQSPIRRIPDRLRKFVSVAGPTDIALDLKVPLDDDMDGETAVRGSATFHQCTLTVDDLDLTVRDIEGPLHFDRDALKADALRANLLGHGVRIAVDQSAGDVAIDVHGRTGIDDLARQFPLDFWAQAQGEADYRLALRFPESLDAQSAPLRLNLESDLAGVALDLPPPLDKPAAAARALSMEMQVKADRKIPVRLEYGPGVRANFRFPEPDRPFRLEGADFAIGLPLAPALPEPGYSLAARLEQADAGAWAQWRPQTGGEGSALGALRRLDLSVGRLAWNGSDLGPLDLAVRRADEALEGRIDSGYAKGRFVATPGTIRLDLDRLRLPKTLGSGGAAGKNPPSIEPAGIPSLTLRANQVLWDRTSLGSLELVTERHAHGMILKHLVVAAPGHRLDVEGGWTLTANRTETTRLQGKLHIDDLGLFLADFGYGGNVRDTPSDLEFSVDWPGAPQRFSAATVAGEVRMTLGQGGLLKIEPGLGRVLGVLDLDTLWRRLSFDFSDLFGQGLAYDGIAGTFRIGGGQAITKGFLIDAVPATIVIGGRAGLVARDLDQAVIVTPHTTVALPIAGALAGGPAVGAAVLLAQQLVGDQVDAITATHYAVKGSWDDPTITKISSNTPLGILGRAWEGVKDISGFGSKQEEDKP